MKKVTKIVTLVSTGLCALALVPAYLATVSAVQAQADNDAHAITFVADEGVTVTVPTVARAGSVVDVTLSYDALTYEVNGILVNGNQMAAYRAVGDSFYFIMPDADAEVVVYGNGVNNGEEHVVHNVQQDKGVILNYTTPTAKAGDYVYFNVGFTTTSAYTWTGKSYIYSLGANGVHEEVDGYEYLADYDAYAFIMPDADVYIDLELEAKGYLANFDSVANVDKVEVSNNNGETWTQANGDQSFLIRAFDKVKVTLKDTSKLKVNGITVNGTSYALEESSMVIVFDMPSKDANITVDTEEKLYAVNVNSDASDTLTANYDFEIYRCKTSSGEYAKTTVGAGYNDYVRVYPTPKEGVTGRKVGTLSYSYDASSSYSWSTATKGVDADGRVYFQFYLYYAKDYTIKVTVENTVKEMAVMEAEHSTGTFVKKVDGEWVENTEGFYPGEKVYAKIVADEGYKIENPKVTYKTSYSTGTASMSKLSGEGNENIYESSTIDGSTYSNFKIEWTELSPLNITFTEDELVTFQLVEEVDNEWVAVSEGQKYFKGDNLYVKANFLGSEEDYAWNGITASTGNVSTQDAANKIYRIYLNSVATTCNITASYKSLSAWKGYSFANKFIGNEFYQTSSSNYFTRSSASSRYTLNLNGSGEGTYGGIKVTVDGLLDGSTKTSGVINSMSYDGTAKTGKYIAYGTDCVAAYYSSFRNEVDTISDYYFGFRIKEASDTESMYSFVGSSNITSYNGGTSVKGYVAMTCKRSGEVYKNLFVDKTDGTNIYYLSNVTFDFVEGGSVSDKSTAVYDVYADGVKVGRVNKGTFTRASNEAGE